MAEGKLYPIVSQAGIKRDGTILTGNYYIDGQWCRFMRGLPRKMGGFRQVVGTLPRIVRDTYIVPFSPNFNVYFGDSDTLVYQAIDQFGTTLGGIVDRTPAGFIADPNNIWQFTLMFSELTNNVQLIAHAAPNLENIDNNVDRPIYEGNIGGGGPLTPTGISVSGGVVAIGPFLFMYGSDGRIKISRANNPTVILNEVRQGGQKIVYGLPIRAGNSSPGGLFWSLNTLIKATLVSTTPEPIFAFDTITDQSSILSSSSVIEYDGKVFWAGVDRFLVYNGIVQEVPNQMNLLYFYQNLNFSQRQKVWATKVPEFGEIWWFYPFGNAIECNKAVIYNIRENSWYDTDISRSSGYYEQVFADPIWTSNDGPAPYSAWIHEIGNDQDIGGNLTAIPSFFETGDVAWVAVGPTGNWVGQDRWVDLERIEPDFWQQTNEILLTVNGREFANSPVESSAPISLLPDTTKSDIREQRRYMTLRFDSNNVGGFYELGQTLLQLRFGDARA